MYELIKLNNEYYLLGDDEAYPYAYHINKKEILKIDGIGEISGELFHSRGFNHATDCKKIIATTDITLGINLLDRNKIESLLSNDIITKKYTHLNILEIRNKLVDLLPTGDVTAWDLISSISNYTNWLDEYIDNINNTWEAEVDIKIVPDFYARGGLRPMDEIGGHELDRTYKSYEYEIKKIKNK
jgi:hypothetical protein